MSQEHARTEKEIGAPVAHGMSQLWDQLISLLLQPLRVLQSVRREHVTADVFAGLTVAAVAIPQAIAYASIAELPPQFGLYTAAIGAIVGSLWGCSRFLATGPVNATSLLVLPVLLAVAVPGTPEFWLAASVIAVMAGALRIVFALLRFGALVTLASKAVLIGFTAGAAVHIAIGQLRHLLGLKVPAMPELYITVSVILDKLGGFHRPSAMIGVGTLLLLVILRRVGPRFPAALVSITVATIAVWALGLDDKGVLLVGEIPRSLPPPTWVTTQLFPDLQLVRGLVMGAMAVAALGLIEATAASQSLARLTGDRLDPNQELFGQGMANIATGLLSGYPCSGSFTRSALAHQSGARTQLAGVFTGVTILAGMLILAPFASLVPRTAIAGVLLVVAWRMLDRTGIRRVIKTSKSETAITTITFAATLILPLDVAVLSGVVFSLAFFVLRSSLPRVVSVVPDPSFRHFIHDPQAPACPQLGVMTIRGPLFFGAVYHIEEELRHNREKYPGQNILALKMDAVDICDLSGIEMLEAAVNTFRQSGGDVYLVRPRRPVLERMRQSGFLDDTLGRDHLLETETAIEFLFDKVLDPSVCVYECEHRVFAECQAIEKHTYDVQFPRTTPRPSDSSRLVSPEDFQELASDTSALVLDVREHSEHQAGHIPGAALLPLRMLPERGASLPRDHTLLVCCRSGRRTARALRMLETMGYTDLYGLQGGILAWRAEGLPVTSPADVEEPEIGPDSLGDLSAITNQQRRVLSTLRLKKRAEALDKLLVFLSETEDLEIVRQTVEGTLDEITAIELRSSGHIKLDPTLPVLIVSDLHTQRTAFLKLLHDKYVGNATNLESIVQGNLQLLLLGDILHSENRQLWQQIEDELVTSCNTDDTEPGPTPAMDREMANSFGLAAMIMTLQRESPAVHMLKGNHENLLNSEERGNAKLTECVQMPGEGELAKSWSLSRFGSSFVARYANWEYSLPIFASYYNIDNGLKFVASHSAPAEPFTLEELERRTDKVVHGVTWCTEHSSFAPDVLRNCFGDDWESARYFATHANSDEGIMLLPQQKVVIISKPRHLVAALVRPGFDDFELHIKSSTRRNR
jgi:SulP family sulfate permease